MSTVLLLTCMVGCAYASYRFTGRQLLSPSVIYPTVFAISIAVGLTEFKNWDFTIHWNTFFLVLASTVVFDIIGCTIHYTGKRTVQRNSSELYRIRIHWVPLAALILIQIFVYALVFHSMSIIVHNYKGPIWVDRTNIIGVYDQLVKFSGENVSLPFLVSSAFLFCGSIGFTLVFVLANNILLTRRSEDERRIMFWQTCLLIVNIILSLGGTVLSGGRTNFLFFIIGSIAITLLVYVNIHGTTKLKWGPKMIGLIGSAIIGIIATFYLLLKLVGRTIQGTSPAYYFAWYVGAPVKNLDIYMQSSHPHNGLFGSMSFRSIYKMFGIKTPDSGLLAFQQINGHQLGNVYTLLGDLFYDFGIFGALLAVAVLSVIIHLIYQLALKRLSSLFTQIAIVIYGYLMRAIVLVFFANQFSTAIGSFGFLLRIIIWSLAPLMFFRYQQLNEERKTLNARDTLQIMINVK